MTQQKLQQQLNEIKAKREQQIATRLKEMMEKEGFSIVPEADIIINGHRLGVKIVVH